MPRIHPRHKAFRVDWDESCLQVSEFHAAIQVGEVLETLVDATDLANDLNLLSEVHDL